MKATSRFYKSRPEKGLAGEVVPIVSISAFEKDAPTGVMLRLCGLNGSPIFGEFRLTMSDDEALYLASEIVKNVANRLDGRRNFVSNGGSRAVQRMMDSNLKPE